MNEFFSHFWPHLTGIAIAIIELVATCHAVLYKRDSRATIGWVGLILLTPLFGAILYWMFGINRIQRRAIMKRSGQAASEPADDVYVASPERIQATLGNDGDHLLRLVELGGTVTGRHLLKCNRVEPLVNGDEAYPAMLAAIDSAQRSISLASYIFDNDEVGRLFIDALERAKNRGVEIRVLLDDIGVRYTFPSIVRMLRKAGIRYGTFMPTLVPGFFAYFNLRSHRKILVIDGELGFTGGMNIRGGCWLSKNLKGPTQDLHFRLFGPIVQHLQEVFAEDWVFSTREVLAGELWYPPLKDAGEMLARSISYGPDEDLGKIRLMLIGALGVAQDKLSIVTPYFLPDDGIIAALNVAAMRGVDVNIMLPERGNLTTVQWATWATLWQYLERGCKIWLTPAPFDHSKLMVVDGLWTLMGSGNWDARSLRLNFEFNVEIYDRQLATRMEALIEAKRAVARRLTLQEVDGRALPIRLRDGVARLLSPYL
ncbi:MAG: cardiolipin synthase [Pirellulales bacterium]|nr:cardiolipin synthase [Pirellulales bacterium]